MDSKSESHTRFRFRYLWIRIRFRLKSTRFRLQIRFHYTWIRIRNQIRIRIQIRPLIPTPDSESPQVWYVLIVSSMKLMYHKGWRTYVLSQILSVTHPPAVGLRSRCRPLTSVSFNYAPLPPFMLPFHIIFDIYIIKLRMWRDGSRLAAVCLGRWKFVGPRRSSLHSVRFGQLLVTLCMSTHCQCNESVHRKEQLLFTPFMTV